MSLANRQVGLVTWLAGAGGLGLLVSFFLTWLSVPPFEVSASQLATLPDVNMGWLVLTPIAGGRRWA